MGQIHVILNVTLDGVIQSPGRPDEDPRDGFTAGGWAEPFAAMQQPEAGEAFSGMGALLFGRWTYESFHAYWPGQSHSPFASLLNDIPKYVVSSTLSEPLAWNNSTLIGQETAAQLRRLKDSREFKIVVFGSGMLVRSMLRWDIVDAVTLLIHPLILGSGRRLFPDDGLFTVLNLLHAKTTGNGVVVASYQPGNHSV